MVTRELGYEQELVRPPKEELRTEILSAEDEATLDESLKVIRKMARSGRMEARGGGSDELLTVDETAAFLKVPKSWVYQRTRLGAIPTRKIGRHVRIPRSELLNWIEDQEVRAA